MTWITWRHHRVALGGMVAFLGALSAWLWIAGLQVHHAYTAAAACHPAGSPACMALILNFHLTSGVLKTGFPLQPAPALIGAFIGAPMLAREIETGTFRYAWTQGFGRWRWTLAKLVIVGVATAAIAGAFSVLLSWYYQPYFATSNGTQLSSASPLSPGLFDLRGVAFAAWTLAAFAIGALAGMLTRRVVPAIVATLASYTILAVLAGIVISHTAWARSPAGQPLLATPVDRGRLPSHAFNAAGHHHRMACPSPRRLNCTAMEHRTRPGAVSLPDPNGTYPTCGCRIPHLPSSCDQSVIVDESAEPVTKHSQKGL